MPGQKKVFRKMTQYKQDMENIVPCMVTIKNVIAIEKISNFAEEIDRHVQLLFGITVSEQEVFLCSVEEDRGNTMFQLTIQVDSLDIEIRDT